MSEFFVELGHEDFFDNRGIFEAHSLVTGRENNEK